MYNSEQNLKKKIDSFHRQLIGQLQNMHYPNIITTTDIYVHTMTRQHLWTDKINQDRLRFTGHILGQLEGTPARHASKIALKPVARPGGRQKTKRIQLTNTLLQSFGLDNFGTNNLQDLCPMAYVNV